MIDEIPVRDRLPKKRVTAFSLEYLAILLGLIFAILLVLLLCSKGVDLVASKIWPQPQPTRVVAKVNPSSDKQQIRIEIPVEAQTFSALPGPTQETFEQSSATTRLPSSSPTISITTEEHELEHPVEIATKTETVTLSKQDESVVIAKPNVKPNVRPKKRKNFSQSKLQNKLQNKKVQPLRYHNPSHYAVQIMGWHDRKRVRTFIKKNRLDKKVTVYLSTLRGKPWYVVVYGEFPSREEASKAISGLPLEARKQKPWIRSVASLQRLSHVAE